MTFVDRVQGQANFIAIEYLKIATLLPILMANIAVEATTHTDETMKYDNLSVHFEGYEAVNHGAGGRVSSNITTNTAEGQCSIFVRGMKGVKQHCDKRHLHFCAGKLAFRFCNGNANDMDDLSRPNAALCGSIGKRLSYKLLD